MGITEIEAGTPKKGEGASSDGEDSGGLTERPLQIRLAGVRIAGSAINLARQTLLEGLAGGRGRKTIVVADDVLGGRAGDVAAGAGALLLGDGAKGRAGRGEDDKQDGRQQRRTHGGSAAAAGRRGQHARAAVEVTKKRQQTGRGKGGLKDERARKARKDDRGR